MRKFFNKIGLFFKSFFNRYVYDKKTRSIVTTFIEIPLIILGLVLKNFNIVLWSLIGLSIFNAIINLIIKKVVKSESVDNIKK